MTDKIDLILNDKSSEIYKNFENIVNINSFTSNLDGINMVMNKLLEISFSLNIPLETVYSSKKARPHLMYGKEKKENFYALIGHFDTVHSPKSDFKSLKEVDGLLKGPGTNDMKSGLIVVMYSCYILKELYPDIELPFKILFNSDEEVGSLDSQEIIEKEFIGALAGFVFEPGRPGTRIVTQRKGIATLDIEIIGKPAHSGVEPWEGINSILAACEIISKLEALNDYDSGIIVGCNQIDGGVARNVVPANTKILVDIRFLTMNQKEKLFDDIENILNSKNSVGAEVKYNLELNRPPLEKSSKSQQIAKLYIDTSNDLGIKCEEMSTGGGSDGNFLSAMGIPTIDGMGAVGNYSHTKKEFIYKESLIYRIKIFVLFMSKLLNK
ncbi:M20/M25/M40 family metallo-hydrolase [Sulfurospirillum sp. 1307]|jgi:glutamate carboxypeptidase